MLVLLGFPHVRLRCSRTRTKELNDPKGEKETLQQEAQLAPHVMGARRREKHTSQEPCCSYYLSASLALRPVTRLLVSAELLGNTGSAPASGD